MQTALLALVAMGCITSMVFLWGERWGRRRERERLHWEGLQRFAARPRRLSDEDRSAPEAGDASE